MVDTLHDQNQVTSASKNAAPSRRHMLASLNERVASVISRLSEHEIVEALVRKTDADSDLACAIQLLTDRGIVLVAMQEAQTENAEFRRGRLFPIDESHPWGRAVRSQQPVILSDIQGSLYVSELAAPIPGANVKSVAIMPLIARWSCLGTITLSASRSDAFDSEAVAALATFASDTALLIENARLYEQAQRRLARMRLARDIFILMHSSLELNDVLRVALRGLEQLTTCSWAALYLLDEGSSELRPVLSTCDAPKDADATIWTVDLTDGSADAISTILRSGQPGVFHPGDILHHRIGGAPLTSPDVRWIVPLTADGRANGMLMAAWQSERDPDDEDTEFVVLVAEEAAVAIQNARRLDAARAMATVDALTGLANFRHVTERLSSELSRARRTGRPLTIVMTDINDFKRINDTHGHLIGNKALNAIAGILRSACRASDLVGRYGGDEFLLVLPDTDLASAQTVWGRIV